MEGLEAKGLASRYFDSAAACEEASALYAEPTRSQLRAFAAVQLARALSLAFRDAGPAEGVEPFLRRA